MDKNERNEHFKGSAHFLLQEMSKRGFIGDDTVLHYEELQTLIAQYAYDLVDQACRHITEPMTHWECYDVVSAVPDLTEWPPTTAE